MKLNLEQCLAGKRTQLRIAIIIKLKTKKNELSCDKINEVHIECRLHIHCCARHLWLTKEKGTMHGLSIHTKLIVISLIAMTRSKSMHELKNTEYK